MHMTDLSRDQNDLDIEDLYTINKAAQTASSQSHFRELILQLLQKYVGFQKGFFHAPSLRIPLTSSSSIGMDIEIINEAISQWNDLLMTFEAIQQKADAYGVVFLEDLDIKMRQSQKSTTQFLWNALQVRSMAVLHCIWRGQLISTIFLFAEKKYTFTEEHRRYLQKILPWITIADAAFLSSTELEQLKTPQKRFDGVRQWHCLDARLTEKQKQIVEHIAAGLRNEEIAQTLGISVNTVRNQITRIFIRLGATNRVDVMRLAVLQAD